MNDEIIAKYLKITPEESEVIKSGRIVITDYTKRRSKKISGSKYFEEREEVFMRRHPRFAEFPEHGHDYTEVMVVLSGSVTHRIGAEKIRLDAGDVIVLNKYVRHSIDNTGENDLGLNILLPDKFILSFAENSNDKILKRFFEESFKSCNDPSFAVFRAGKSRVIDNLIENLAELFMSEKKIKNAAVNDTVYLLLELLSSFSEKIVYQKNTTDFSEAFPEVRDAKYEIAIRKYVSTEFVGGSLSACARELGVNVQYLSRLTKKIFGKNFKQLLIAKRLERAEKLIRSGTLTIQEVASAVGYENVYGFNTAFHNKHGVYASEWKKQQER